jgi:hypothetical protein
MQDMARTPAALIKEILKLVFIEIPFELNEKMTLEQWCEYK